MVTSQTETGFRQALLALLQKSPAVDVPRLSARIYVYGAGSYGRRVGRALEAAGYHVFAYVDDKAVGRELNGRAVVGSRELAQADADDWLLVALMNRDVDLAAKCNHLAACCSARQQTPPQFVHWLDSPELRYFWLADHATYARMADAILEGIDLWADQQSRSSYLRLWLYRLSGDVRWLETPDLTDQYLPKDLAMDIDCQCFVDCGAYDGDTLRSLARAGRMPERWFAFEPDADNFDQLRNFISTHRCQLGEVYCWPCGIWSSNTQLRFSSTLGEASNLSDQGETTIQCVALDDVLSGIKPSFIKMDVEGAEWQALQGAKRLLEHHPALAISAYHRPEDLWRLPGYLESLSLVYRYYLRLHGHQGFDAVLYAIPEGDVK